MTVVSHDIGRFMGRRLLLESDDATAEKARSFLLRWAHPNIPASASFRRLLKDAEAVVGAPWWRRRGPLRELLGSVMVARCEQSASDWLLMEQGLPPQDEGVAGGGA